MDQRTSQRPVLRIIAMTLVVTMALSELSHAGTPETLAGRVWAGSGQRALSDPSLIEAPAAFCRIKETHSSEGQAGKTLILHFQDAHCNLTGQENLARSLDAVIERYGVRLVMVEGGSRDDTLTDLKKIAPPDVWKKVARRFLVEGKIAGEEYLNLTTDHPMKIVGVEDRKLYLESVRAYAELARHRDGILLYLGRVRRSLESIKLELYPEELLDHETDGGISADDPSRSLGWIARFQTDLEKFPNLQKIARIRSMEGSIDFDRAGLEQAALVERLRQAGAGERVRGQLEKFNEAKDSRAAQSALFQNIFNIAREMNVPSGAYPELQKYAEYLRGFQGVDLDALLGEMQAAEDGIYRARLAERGQDALTARAIDRYLRLLETAYSIQMSSDDFTFLRANEPDFATPDCLAWVNRKLTELGRIEEIVPASDALETGRAALEAFYSSVSARDTAFVKNAETVMRAENESTAVLISGGYHTPHLKQLFRGKGWSYAVITPIVTAETNQKKYEDILLAPVRGRAEGAEIVSSRPIENARPEAMSESGARLSEMVMAAAKLAGTPEAEAMKLLSAAGGRLSKREEWHEGFDEAKKSEGLGVRELKKLLADAQKQFDTTTFVDQAMRAYWEGRRDGYQELLKGKEPKRPADGAKLAVVNSLRDAVQNMTVALTLVDRAYRADAVQERIVLSLAITNVLSQVRDLDRILRARGGFDTPELFPSFVRSEVSGAIMRLASILTAEPPPIQDTEAALSIISRLSRAAHNVNAFGRASFPGFGGGARLAAGDVPTVIPQETIVYNFETNYEDEPGPAAMGDRAVFVLLPVKDGEPRLNRWFLSMVRELSRIEQINRRVPRDQRLAYEIFVLSNGSTDDTVKMVQDRMARYRPDGIRINFIHTPGAIGKNGAINELYRRATERYRRIREANPRFRLYLHFSDDDSYPVNGPGSQILSNINFLEDPEHARAVLGKEVKIIGTSPVAPMIKRPRHMLSYLGYWFRKMTNVRKADFGVRLDQIYGQSYTVNIDDFPAEGVPESLDYEDCFLCAHFWPHVSTNPQAFHEHEEPDDPWTFIMRYLRDIAHRENLARFFGVDEELKAKYDAFIEARERSHRVLTREIHRRARHSPGTWTLLRINELSKRTLEFFYRMGWVPQEISDLRNMVVKGKMIRGSSQRTFKMFKAEGRHYGIVSQGNVVFVDVEVLWDALAVMDLDTNFTNDFTFGEVERGILEGQTLTDADRARLHQVLTRVWTSLGKETTEPVKVVDFALALGRESETSVSLGEFFMPRKLFLLYHASCDAQNWTMAYVAFSRLLRLVRASPSSKTLAQLLTVANKAKHPMSPNLARVIMKKAIELGEPVTIAGNRVLVQRELKTNLWSAYDLTAKTDIVLGFAGEAEHASLAAMNVQMPTHFAKPLFYDPVLRLQAVQKVDGKSFPEISTVNRSVLDWVDIAIEVCRATLEMHKKNLVHGDLRRPNAMASQRDGRWHVVFLNTGTVDWREHLGFRADIFGVGAMLYNGFSQRDPSLAGSYESIGLIPDRMESIVRRALEKGRADEPSYQSIDELLADLLSFRTSLTALADEGEARQANNAIMDVHAGPLDNAFALDDIAWKGGAFSLRIPEDCRFTPMQVAHLVERQADRQASWAERRLAVSILCRYLEQRPGDSRLVVAVSRDSGAALHPFVTQKILTAYLDPERMVADSVSAIGPDTAGQNAAETPRVGPIVQVAGESFTVDEMLNPMVFLATNSKREQAILKITDHQEFAYTRDLSRHLERSPARYDAQLGVMVTEYYPRSFEDGVDFESPEGILVVLKRFIDVARELAVLNRRMNVIHRDSFTHNIKLSEDKNAHLIDLGLAEEISLGTDRVDMVVLAQALKNTLQGTWRWIPLAYRFATVEGGPHYHEIPTISPMFNQVLRRALQRGYTSMDAMVADLEAVNVELLSADLPKLLDTFKVETVDSLLRRSSDGFGARLADGRAARLSRMEGVGASGGDIRYIFKYLEGLEMSEEMIRQVEESFVLALEIHRGQPRWQGAEEPYIEHLVRVARILIQKYKLFDVVKGRREAVDALCAAFLHDAMEDVTEGELGRSMRGVRNRPLSEAAKRNRVARLIRERVNERVMDAVRALSKPLLSESEKAEPIGVYEREVEYILSLRRQPLGVQVVKIADWDENFGRIPEYESKESAARFFLNRAPSIIDVLPKVAISAGLKVRFLQHLARTGRRVREQLRESSPYAEQMDERGDEIRNAIRTVDGARLTKKKELQPLEWLTAGQRDYIAEDTTSRRLDRFWAAHAQFASMANAKARAHSAFRKMDLEEAVDVLMQENAGTGITEFSASEVARRMRSFTDISADKDKYTVLSRWMKERGLAYKDFRITPNAKALDSKNVARFHFAGLAFDIPPALSGKIRALGNVGDSAEMRLVSVADPATRIVLRDTGAQIQFQFTDPLTNQTVADAVGKPASSTLPDTDVLPSFIRFMDAVLNIPSEFAEEDEESSREAAIKDWLQSNGKLVPTGSRGETSHSLTIGNTILYLPSYYAKSMNKLVLYKDQLFNSRRMAIVDAADADNFIVLEVRRIDGKDRVVSSHTGEALPVREREGENSVCNLSGFPLFRAFDERISKLGQPITLEPTVSTASHLVLGKTHITFWHELPLTYQVLSKGSGERALRARTSRDDMGQYPLTITRPDGKTVEIRIDPADSNQCTVSGLTWRADGRPVLLTKTPGHTSFNLSVIAELVRKTNAGDWIAADDLFLDTFPFMINPVPGELAPLVNTYRLDPTQGTLVATRRVRADTLERSQVEVAGAKLAVIEPLHTAAKRLEEADALVPRAFEDDPSHERIVYSLAINNILGIVRGLLNELEPWKDRSLPETMAPSVSKQAMGAVTRLDVLIRALPPPIADQESADEVDRLLNAAMGALDLFGTSNFKGFGARLAKKDPFQFRLYSELGPRQKKDKRLLDLMQRLLGEFGRYEEYPEDLQLQLEPFHPDGKGDTLVLYSRGVPVGIYLFVRLKDGVTAQGAGVFASGRVRQRGIGTRLRGRLFTMLRAEGYKTFRIGTEAEPIREDNQRAQGFHEALVRSQDATGSLAVDRYDGGAIRGIVVDLEKFAIEGAKLAADPPAATTRLADIFGKPDGVKLSASATRDLAEPNRDRLKILAVGAPADVRTTGFDYSFRQSGRFQNARLRFEYAAGGARAIFSSTQEAGAWEERLSAADLADGRRLRKRRDDARAQYRQNRRAVRSEALQMAKTDAEDERSFGRVMTELSAAGALSADQPVVYLVDAANLTAGTASQFRRIIAERNSGNTAYANIYFVFDGDPAGPASDDLSTIADPSRMKLVYWGDAQKTSQADVARLAAPILRRWRPADTRVGFAPLELPVFERGKAPHYRVSGIVMANAVTQRLDLGSETLGRLKGRLWSLYADVAGHRIPEDQFNLENIGALQRFDESRRPVYGFFAARPSRVDLEVLLTYEALQKMADTAA